MPSKLHCDICDKVIGYATSEQPDPEPFVRYVEVISNRNGNVLIGSFCLLCLEEELSRIRGSHGGH